MSIRPDMPNTIRLKIKENTKVNRKEILNALKDQFNNVKDVDYISQVYNNKTWFITFKENYNIQEMVNKRLSIESQDILIIVGSYPGISPGYPRFWYPRGYPL